MARNAVGQVLHRQRPIGNPTDRMRLNVAPEKVYQKKFHSVSEKYSHFLMRIKSYIPAGYLRVQAKII